MALKDRPGGIIRPFCEPEIVTSTPQASCWKSEQAREEMASTISSAGWAARFIASRTGSTWVMQLVDVSLWTTQTALILCDLSAARRSSMAATSAPRRQSVSSSTGSRPSRCAICTQRWANQPVWLISTWSPGDKVLSSAASQAPVPDAG